MPWRRWRYPADCPLGFLLAYYLGTGLMFLPSFLLFRGPFDRKAMPGFGSALSNILLLGAPLAITALAPEAAVPVFLIISFHSALFFTVLTLLVEGSRGSTAGLWRLPHTLLRSLSMNTFLITILGGLLFAASGLTLPTPLDHGLDLLGQRRPYPGRRSRWAPPCAPIRWAAPPAPPAS